MSDAQWLEWRRAGIGASDVAAAAQGRYGGSYGVVASKLGGVKDESNQDRKNLGHAWEERLADIVTTATGLYVVGEQMWCEHAEHPHRRATVDGFLAYADEVTVDDVTAVLELKTRHPNAGSMWSYYADQVQYQMHVTGVGEAVLCEATIGNDDDLLGIRLDRIEADPDRQAFLADAADWLWEHVQAGTYPEPDTPDALDAVKARHATASDDDTPVDLSELEEAIARHKAIKEAEKAVGDELKLLEAQIREALGSAKKGTAPGWSVSLSAPSRVLTDTAAEAFLLVHPDAAKQTIDRAKAEQIDKALLDELKEPVGARTLRITRKATT